MIVIGLTGSMGMGKSETSRMFTEEGGGPVQSADDVVHHLYRAGGRGAKAIEELEPDAIGRDGSVDRQRLRERLRLDPDLLERVEAVIHPLVQEERHSFVARAQEAGATFVVLEIPLLFETGAEKGVDTVVVVTAPESVQRERVLARPGMDQESYRRMLAKQTPDAEKQRRADHIIQTGDGMEAARTQVRAVLAKLGLRPPSERRSATEAGS